MIDVRPPLRIRPVLNLSLGRDRYQPRGWWFVRSLSRQSCGEGTSRNARLSRRIRGTESRCTLACSVAAGSLFVCASGFVLQTALSKSSAPPVCARDGLLAARRRIGIGASCVLRRHLIVLHSRRCPRQYRVSAMPLRRHAGTGVCQYERRVLLSRRNIFLTGFCIGRHTSRATLDANWRSF
jgi:hypothetical protein